ncbi:MAG TPA: hypothetical protein DCY13_15250 [Verrucomicrobiales bacterium]|nr:hypothetical protein [Verrucomicrobiales bacterium]
MKPFRTFTSALLAVAAVSAIAPTYAEDADQVPFEEVRALIRLHLANTSDEELNDAAVKGLIDQLKPHVMVGEMNQTVQGSTNGLVAKSSRFRRDFGYLRMTTVTEGLDQAIRSAVEELLREAPLKGLVLDLRFATGDNYAAAAAAAGLFAEGERVMLKVGDKVHSGSGGNEAILIPVMVLVNKATAGAAEAFAASLKSMKAGLLVGAATAGRATLFETFTLSNGTSLRIATQPVRLADDTAIPRSGLSPDIAVEIDEADERKYLDDPYWVAPGDGNGGATSSPRRVTEADLVRQRREGIPLEQIIEDRAESSERRLVTDPVLARGLDLLKALTVVQSWKRE